MIRKIKRRLGRWKIVALGLVVMGLFFVSACQDQVMNEVADIAKSSSMATEVPEKIQKRYEQLKTENPEKKYLLVELNDHAMARIDELKKIYGRPTSLEIFEFDDKNPPGENHIIGTSEAGVEFRRAEGSSTSPKNGFLILEYNEQTMGVTDLSATGNVYSIVEETPEVVGGMPALFKYIGESMVYPKEAIAEKAEGTVYVQFIVETNGEITSPEVVKGVHPLLDAEALRVVTGSPTWIPGKQKGVAVRTKMVLPIKFNLKNVGVK